MPGAAMNGDTKVQSYKVLKGLLCQLLQAFLQSLQTFLLTQNLHGIE